MRCLSSLFLKKVVLFWQPTQQRKSFLRSNDTPAHRRTEATGPWAGIAFIRAYCSRNRPARFPVRQGRADTAGVSNGAGTAAGTPALQSGHPEAEPRPCPPGPTLPAFLSPNVAALLVENFGIAGIDTVENDMELFFGK